MTVSTKSTLDKKFTHAKWHKGETITRREALDHFAKCGDFYLDKKPSKIQSDNLFADINYDDVIKYAGRDRSTYKPNEEEKEYFTLRVEFWKQERQRESDETMNRKVDANEQLDQLERSLHHRIKDANRNIDTWLNKYNDLEMVATWKKYLSLAIQSLELFNEMASSIKDTLISLRDFQVFKDGFYSERAARGFDPNN